LEKSSGRSDCGGQRASREFLVYTGGGVIRGKRSEEEGKREEESAGLTYNIFCYQAGLAHLGVPPDVFEFFLTQTLQFLFR
jgi:hypothetical protein